MSVEDARFAHSEGRVSLAYSRDGKKIHTLGMDGEMRVWSGIDDDDCENILVGEEGFAVAVASSRLLFVPQAVFSVFKCDMLRLMYFTVLSMFDICNTQNVVR